MIQQLKKTVSGLQTLSGLTLFACLPMFFSGVTRISMLMFIGLSIVEYFLDKRYQYSQFFTLHKAPFWACIAYFLLLIIYAPFEQDTQHLPLFIESRSAFLIFGVLGLLDTKVPPAKYLAGIAIGMSTILIAYTLYLAYSQAPEVVTNWQKHIILTRHTNIHAHMAFNMYLNVAMAACFWFIKQYKSWFTRGALTLLIVLFYSAVAFSNARTGFVASNIIIMAGIIYLLWDKQKILVVSATVLLAIVGGTLILNNHKVEKMLSTQKDVRYDIWIESVSLLKQAPLLGVGASTNVEHLIDVFLDSPYIIRDRALIDSCLHPDISGAHPHNQLIQSSMEFGLLGLLTMLGILLLPIAYMVKYKCNLVLLTFWSVIVIQLQTEVIRGSLGDYAFCLYLLFAMYYAQQSSKKVVGSMQGHDQLPSTSR